jgi:hypothetical protein
MASLTESRTGRQLYLCNKCRTSFLLQRVLESFVISMVDLVIYGSSLLLPTPDVNHEAALPCSEAGSIFDLDSNATSSPEVYDRSRDAIEVIGKPSR